MPTILYNNECDKQKKKETQRHVLRLSQLHQIQHTNFHHFFLLFSRVFWPYTPPPPLHSTPWWCMTVRPSISWFPDYSLRVEWRVARVANWPIVRPHNSKGPNKMSAGKKCRRISGRFFSERAVKGPKLWPFCFLFFLFLFSLIQGNSKKHCTFSTQIDTRRFVFWSPNAFKKVKITGGRIFFLVGRNFPPNWPKSSS